LQGDQTGTGIDQILLIGYSLYIRLLFNETFLVLACPG